MSSRKVSASYSAKKFYRFKPVYGEWFLAFRIPANKIFLNYVSNSFALLWLFKRRNWMTFIRYLDFKYPVAIWAFKTDFVNGNHNISRQTSQFLMFNAHQILFSSLFASCLLSRWKQFSVLSNASRREETDGYVSYFQPPSVTLTA